jgi:hypothetical protein
MLNGTPSSSRMSATKSPSVNWLPWSVLKISGENATRRPINNGEEIQEASLHWDVGNIR